MRHIKPITVLVIVLSFACSGISQELARHVFSSGGDNYAAVAVQLSWTIGQAEPVGTNPEPTVILCSGFQQFDDQLVSVREVDGNHEIALYPNPCKDFVRLSASFRQSTSLTYSLVDLQGRTLIRESLSGNNVYLEEIPMDDLSPGMYNLLLLIGDGDKSQVKSIKIIKN